MANVPIIVVKPFGLYSPGPAHIDESRLPYLEKKGLAYRKDSPPPENPESPEQKTLDKEFDEYLSEHLSDKVYAALQESGLNDLEAIQAVSDENIVSLENVGPKTCKMIRQTVERFVEAHSEE